MTQWQRSVSQSGSVDQRGASQSEVSMARDQINSPISLQGNHETLLAEGGSGAVKVTNCGDVGVSHLLGYCGC